MIARPPSASAIEPVGARGQREVRRHLEPPAAFDMALPHIRSARLPRPRTIARCARSAATRARSLRENPYVPPKFLAADREKPRRAQRRRTARPDARATNRSRMSWISVPRSAASGSFANRLERAQLQDLAGIDRVGIADQRLDARHRELLRAQYRSGGEGRGGVRRSMRVGRVEAARPAQSVARRASASSSARSSPACARRRCSQRDATCGSPSCRSARVSQTSGCPSACAKSCAARPIRRSGGSSVERRAHRPRQQRVEPRLGRPRAFVQAAEHDRDRRSAAAPRARPRYGCAGRGRRAAAPRSRSISAVNRPG